MKTKFNNFLNRLQKNQPRREAGFTLTEIIIYMSLLIVLITILTMIFSSILDVQLESESTSSVELDGRYILSKFIYDMHSMQASDSIATPAAPGNSGSTLSFTVNSINYTYALNNDNLQLTNDKGTNNINSSDTAISGLQFTRIGTGTNTDTIRVSFTVTSKITRKGGAEFRNYQTTISAQ